MASIVVVVLTFTRIIKSVVAGQAPVTLELRNTPASEKHNYTGCWLKSAPNADAGELIKQN